MRIGLFVAVVAVAYGLSGEVVSPVHPTQETVIAEDVFAPAAVATDDVSAALQKRLDALSSRGGGTIFLPAGVYTLAAPVIVPPGTVVRGDYAPDDFAGSTVIRIVCGRGEADGPAAFSLRAGAGLVGLYFWYPEQSIAAPVAYPWTVRSAIRHFGGIDNHTVSDCTFVNSWQGVRFGPEPNELHLLRRVCMTALKTGVAIDSTTDVGRLVEVDVSPRHWCASGAVGSPDETALRSFLRTNGMIGFDFGRTDWEYAYRLRVEGAAIGFNFARGVRGGTSGGFAGIETVGCAVGVSVSDLCTAGLAFYGCRFRNDENLKIGPKVPAVTVCDSCVFEGSRPVSETPHALVLSGPERMPDLSRFASRPAISPAPGRLFRVEDFGASVTAKDNTAAFQRALDAAGEAGGGTVYAPAGFWRLDGTLTVPARVELRGSSDVPHHTFSGGTMLLTTSGRGQETGTPFLSLAAGSSLRGLTVWYPDQPVRAPVAYPWAVRALGPDCRIVDVTLANAWQGLDLETHDCTGHYVSYLAGACWRRGLAVGRSRGGFIEDVQLNPHYVVRRPVGLPVTPGPDVTASCSGGIESDLMRKNLEAMTFTDARGELTRGLFVYAPAKGISVRGSSEIGMLIGGGDMGPEIWLVDLKPDGRLFSALAQLTPWDNGAGWHGPALRFLPTDAGRTKMRSSLFFLAYAPTLVKEGCGELTLDGFSSRLGRIDLRNGWSKISNGIFAFGSEGHVCVSGGEASIHRLEQRNGIRIKDETGRAQVTDCQIAPPVDATLRTEFRVGVDAPLLENVRAPRGGVREVVDWSCTRAEGPGVTIRLKGRSENPSYSYFYCDVATNAIRVTDESVCSFRLMPLTPLGCEVSVDLAFADGSVARDRGLFIIPRPGSARVGKWTDVRVPLGSVSCETITHVMLRWDSRKGGGPVEALVSDLRFERRAFADGARPAETERLPEYLFRDLGTLTNVPRDKRLPFFDEQGVYSRPSSEIRAFRSSAVEEKIREVLPKIPDAKFATLFANCFPNTLDTTVSYRELPDGDDDTFVYTGDIPAMWLRDSSAQVWPYLPLMKDDEPLRRMIRGVLRRQFRSIVIDPYANAFNPVPNGRGHPKAPTKMRPELWERKYEIDSLCYPIRLAYGYWRQSGDASIFDAQWMAALDAILKTFREQQRKNGWETPYRFYGDNVINRGYGAPVRPVGLIASFFRPSDDACVYPFLIPSNFFAVDVLRKAAEICETVCHDTARAKSCRDLADEVDAALCRHAVVKHPKYGEIYAFEVDGFGNALMIDDANVPSLLALPYFSEVKKDDPVYLNTRRFVFSPDNPYFFVGKAGAGIGGPHCGFDRIWPMSYVLKAMTATDDDDIVACLRMIRRSDAGKGLMHESYDKDDPAVFSRAWFAWANTLFGELILKLDRDGKLDLLKEAGNR